MAGRGEALDGSGSPPPSIPEGKIIIAAHASELVGLPNYSNVTIGPFAAWRVVDVPEDLDDEAFQKFVAEQFQLLSGAAEMAVSQQRAIVLAAVKRFAEGGGYKDVRG